MYDDLVEATADVVERSLRPWDPACGRFVATVAAGLLLGLAAVALQTQRGSRSAAVAAVVVAVSLIGGAVVLSRARHEPVAAVTIAWPPPPRTRSRACSWPTGRLPGCPSPRPGWRSSPAWPGWSVSARAVP